MTTFITELLSETGDVSLPATWCIQVITDEASTAITFLDAETGKKHWIESVVITPVANEWFKIMDGDSNLIGPFAVAAGTTWKYNFRRDIHGTENTALKIKTQSNSGIHMIIEGHTDAYPSKAYNPSPADEATGVAISAVLTWESSPQIISHDVYFGTSSPPLFILNQQENSYDPDLEASTTYYWRIDEKDGENTIAGDVWTFTTGG